MLKMVLSHLDQDNSIGTVDEPRGYFAARLPLRWGGWQDFVYLGGRTERTVLALGGSVRHLTTHFDSPLPGVPEASSSIGLRRLLSRTLSEEGAGSDVTSESVLWWALRATTGQRGDREALEFVARRLAHGEAELPQDWSVRPDFEDLKLQASVSVLLGSPLYLAYVD
jgi:hypothetical protein